MNQETVYTTSDQGIAAYFMERGYFCAGTVPGKDTRFPDRRLFVFTDVPDPKSIEADWFHYRQEPMSARAYFDKLRMARHMLRESKDK